MRRGAGTLDVGRTFGVFLGQNYNKFNENRTFNKIPKSPLNFLSQIEAYYL